MRVVESERGGRAGDGRAVDETEALLRALSSQCIQAGDKPYQDDRLDVVLLERLVGEEDDGLGLVRAVDDADVAARSADGARSWTHG